MRACLRCGGSDPGLTPNPSTLPQDTSCNSEKPRVLSEKSPVVWDWGGPVVSWLPTS